MKNKYSKNNKLNNVLVAIESDLMELGISEVKRYMKDFPRESDYNLAQYGNMLVYYYQVRDLYKDYQCVKSWSDDKLWKTYLRQVGWVARQLAK